MKYFLLILMLALNLGSQAQLQLRKNFLSRQNTYYFELVNTGNLPVQMDCHSLLAHYRNDQETGFLIIRLPEGEVPPGGSLQITNSNQEWANIENRKRLMLTDLFAQGRVEKLVYQTAENVFSTASRPLDLPGSSHNLDDHLVILYNGSVIKDASFTLDSRHNLPPYLQRLPDLAFDNSCREPITVRFRNLQQVHPMVFTRPNEINKPGEFREFEIRKNAASVQIAWSTMREQNSRGFEIQRRADNEQWTTVGFVASLAPRGNSDQTLNYLYGDNQATTGTVQYRLKQVDVNGQSWYGPERTVNFGGEVDKLTVFPNPSPDGRATLAFGQVNTLRDIQLMDMNGRMIQQWVGINNSTQQVNGLPQGTYVIKVYDRQTGNVHTEKLLVRSR